MDTITMGVDVSVYSISEINDVQFQKEEKYKTQ